MKLYQILVDLCASEEYNLPNSRWTRYEVAGHGIALGNLAIHARFGTSITKALELGELHLAIDGTEKKMKDSG